MPQTAKTVTQDPATYTGLTDGESYAMQNRGPEPVFFSELAAPPDRDTLPEGAIEIAPTKRPNEFLEFVTDAATPPVLWTSQGNALVVISDVE